MQFNYVAYTMDRGVFKGKVDAEDELEARQEVVRQGYRPLEVKRARQAPAWKSFSLQFSKLGRAS